MLIERGHMDQLTGGYFIRGVVPIHPMPNRWVGSMTDNKENIIPVTSQVVQPTREGRSPLPYWYPRTPLRDITAVLKAIERREQRRATIAAQQPEPPTESIEESSAPPPEQLTPELTTQAVPISTPALPPITPKPEQEKYVQKLSESIEQLEKIVMRNVKGDNAKKRRAMKRDVQRKTLRSMR
ncbi:uncharacterized protein LOC144557347 [Carex rostrata]